MKLTISNVLQVPNGRNIWLRWKGGGWLANCVALNVSLLKRLPIEIKEEMMDLGPLGSCNRALRKSCGRSCQFPPGMSRGGWIQPFSSSPLLCYRIAHYRSITFWLTLPRASQNLSIEAVMWTFFLSCFFVTQMDQNVEFIYVWATDTIYFLLQANMPSQRGLIALKFSQRQRVVRDEFCTRPEALDKVQRRIQAVPNGLDSNTPQLTSTCMNLLWRRLRGSHSANIETSGPGWALRLLSECSWTWK